MMAQDRSKRNFLSFFSGKQFLIPLAALLALVIFNLIADPEFFRVTLGPICRWRGDLGPGHLRHDAIHPEPHLHVVCGPGSQHGLPASGCWHPRHAPLTPQLPHHDPPALWGCPGECALRAALGVGMGV